MPHYSFIRRHMVVSISRVRVPNPDRAEVPTKPVRESPPVTASGGRIRNDKGICGCLTEARVSLCLAPPAFPVNRADAESLIPRLLRPSIFCYFEDYGPWRPPCVYDT